MPERIWIFAIIIAMLAAAFSYLLKLFDTADAARKGILACGLWSDDNFPTTVADIEGDRDRSVVVSAYYAMVDRIYRSIGAYSVGSIAILLCAILVIAFHESLDAIVLRGTGTMLGLVQVAIFALASMYTAWVVMIVNDKSWLKGQVDAAIQRIETKKKNADAKPAVVPADAATKVPIQVEVRIISQ